MHVKTTVIAVTSMSAVLLASMIRSAPATGEVAAPKADPALGGAVAGVAQTAAVSDLPYNRRIDDIGFAPGVTGLTNVRVLYSMSVADTGATADLDGEIMIDVLVGGSVVASGVMLGEFDFLSNDAITCAVTCASNCGSIFGDGVCGGCNCNYARVGSLPLAVPAGATVRATILSFGTPEIQTDDDVLEVVFGAPTEPCDEDLDNSGAVDFGDLLRILSNWGPCP